MAHLHPERFKELADEFRLAALFGEALKIIDNANPRTDGVSRAHHFAHHGLQCLHPATRNPEAVEEMHARMSGSYAGPSAPAAGPGSSELSRINAEIAKLEAQKAERDAQAKLDALRAELDPPKTET